MSVTTAADLLVRAHHQAIALRDSHDPITLAEWERFDVTLHRALHEVLGPDASGVPRDDPQRPDLTAAIRDWPAPLRPPADIPLTPAQAARQLAVTERTVYRRIADGRLAAIADARSVVVQARDLDTRPDITPADPVDPHPLARLTVTIGLLVDQLNASRAASATVLSEPGEAATTTRHLLAMGRLAAGRAIAAMPYADAARPVALAQYCERVLDTLAGPTIPPASLQHLRAVASVHGAVELGDRLEAVLHDWSRAARDDLTRAIPAMTGLRLLGNQAVHLYAVTHQLLGADPERRLDAGGATAQALIVAAHAAQAVDPLWADVTTFARPTLEYATASQALFTVLNDVTSVLKNSDRGDLNTQRALADLGQGTTTVAEIMTATRDLPERLARAQLLHIPKGRTTLVDLHTHRRLATKHATIYEVEDLIQMWRRSGVAARDAATQMPRSLGTRDDDPLRALAPFERSL